MSISFNRIPEGVRTPLYHVEIDNSKAGYFVTQQRALLIGQRLPTGAAVAAVPVLVGTAEEAAELFGHGSMLARMAATYRRNDAFGELWALPLDDHPAGVAASGTVTLSGVALKAGLISLYIAGRRIQVPVAAGDTAATVAATLAAVVGVAADLPVTASVLDAVVTLTARHAGETGNDLDLRVNYRGAPGGERTPDGLTVAIAAMTGGAGNPDLAPALAVLGDDEYDFVAMPYTDDASLDTVKEEWGEETGRWAWNRQIYGHVWAARRGTMAELSTFGATRNDPAVSVLGYADSPTPPEEWASAFCAAAASSLKADPARPLQTLPLLGVLAPVRGFSRQERQVLLYDGIATHMVGADGTVMIERAITTYQTNGWGQPDPSYLDANTRYQLMRYIRRRRQRMAQEFGRAKLADDGTAFGAGQAIVTPNIVRATLVAMYSEDMAAGQVENLEAYKANLIVTRNPDDPNRLDILDTPDLINQLRILATQVQFRLQY